MTSSIAKYLAQEVVKRLGLDSESGMSPRTATCHCLNDFRELLEPYLGDGQRTAALIANAEAEGFEFGDRGA